jgi:hypothetical protein
MANIKAIKMLSTFGIPREHNLLTMGNNKKVSSNEKAKGIRITLATDRNSRNNIIPPNV